MEWISVGDRLPDIEACGKPGCTHCASNACCNSVLAYWKPGQLADYLPNPQVCNTVYFTLHSGEFSHWMPLPPPPSPEGSGDVMKGGE